MARLRHIDTLRGIAILAVVIQHILESTGFTSFVNLGRFGVLLFFLISGYVIPFSFSGERPLRRFAISRAFRLYPAYWASLAAAVILARTGDLETVLLNVTMIQRLFAVPDVVWVYWSLFYELSFYGLCCALFASGALKRSNILALLAVLSLTLHIELCLADRLPPIWNEGFEFIGFMLVGSVLRRAHLDLDRIAIRWAMPLITLLSITGLVAAGIIHRVPMNSNPFMSVRAMGLAATGAILVFHAVNKARFEWAPMTYLGKISYSVYLFHAVALIAVGSLKLPLPNFVIVVVMATLTISVLSYQLVEVPATTLRRWITKDRSSEARSIAI